MADKLPAARRRQRVDPGLLSADAYRSGRHRETWLRATRGMQGFRQPAQIGKARLETEEPNHIVDGGMQLNHLLFAEVTVLCHDGQIRPRRAAVHHRDLNKARLWLQGLALLPPAL